MSNHSLMTADRSTHFKITAVAVVAAIVLVAVGFRARIDTGTDVARIETSKVVVKAGKPVTAASSDTSSIR
jgi:predicted dinucleotide-binding enzyme